MVPSINFENGINECAGRESACILQSVHYDRKIDMELCAVARGRSAARNRRKESAARVRPRAARKGLANLLPMPMMVACMADCTTESGVELARPEHGRRES